MKNENIRKINTLGKVSRIILVIMRVACIIGIVACAVGIVLTLLAPKSDYLTAGTATAQLTVDDSVNFITNKPLVSIGGFKVGSVEDLEECDESIDLLGTKVDFKVDETESDGKRIYDITADLNADNAKAAVLFAVLACVLGMLVSGVMLVIVIFGGRFARALEICDSPFEENVITSMKHFAMSLIPLGIVYVFGGDVNITGVVLVIAVIMFYYIFKHGAELQKESDETV